MNMFKYCIIFTLFLFISCSMENKDKQELVEDDMVRLINLAPGHFHASLVQKFMNPRINSTVHVYAEDGPELEQYLQTIQGFNTRSDQATHWKEEVYRGKDFLEKMGQDKSGDVVLISGNNERKTEYIQASLAAGMNVLADKPMVINGQDFDLLLQLFPQAADKGKLLYDVMTERYEISNILQREFSQFPDLFGELEKGSTEEPSVIIESVHHFSKKVAGNPIKRPAWFFDITQQGESIVDVATHLVDLAQWGCFPGITLKPEDVELLHARHWPTILTPSQFKKVTQLDSYPAYLDPYVDEKGNLSVLANGEFTYSLKGIHIKIIARWDFEAPAGGGDTHFAIMRGTKAQVIIRQGAEQQFRPAVYLKPASESEEASFEKVLASRISQLETRFPGLGLKKGGEEWEISIPDEFRVGHEAHFGEVMNKFLTFLEEDDLPDWEVPNMITKYYTTVKALEMAKED